MGARARQRRHERGEQAAQRLQEILVKPSIDLGRIHSKQRGGTTSYTMVDFIMNDFTPVQTELMIHAGHLTDAHVREELAFVIYGIGWSPAIAAKQNPASDEDETQNTGVGIQLAEYGRWIPGTYLRGTPGPGCPGSMCCIGTSET